MGLFSKLFSREGEDPTQSEDPDARAATATVGEEGVKKREESAASPDARARPGQDKTDLPPLAANDKARGRPDPQPAPANAAPAKRIPALEPPPAATGGARKPAEPARREPPLPAKPPAALGANQRAPAAPTPVGSEAASSDTSTSRSGVNPQAPLPRQPLPPARKAAARPATEAIKPKPLQPFAQRPELGGAPAAAGRAVDAQPLDAALDAALDALIDPNAAGREPSNDNAGDQRALIETFADMAKVHAQPLRELMFQLSLGRTPKHWATASRPVLRPLFDAASQIGLLELVGGLGAFDAALERAASDPGTCIGDAAAELLTSAYERLRQQMPEAFTKLDRSDSRRLILLESLLLEVPRFQRRILGKLSAAGVATLGQLSQAKPDELAAVAGIELELASAIIEHVQRFELERSRINPSGLRAYLQGRLRGIVGRLAQFQNEFEQAEQEDSPERKRAARRARESALLELDLVCAEAGEVDLIEELKRCPVRGKIRRVESYLEQQQGSA